MAELTEQIADFASSPLPVPAEVARVVERGFIDTVATMLAGSGETVVRIVRRWVGRRRSAAGEASVLLGPERAACADAALVNATSAHALDYDDVALGGHPSTVLVPSVLAAAEGAGASGARAIEAYLVGYETWAELAAREPDAYHEKGWHPTAVLGTVAAAAAVGRLLELPAGTCRHALGIAASMASGLVANFGSMTKPLHAGRAAACAIDAVELASEGMTSSPDALESATGYLAALSPRARADRGPAATKLGSRLRIREAGLSIKRYPVCYSAHRAIDGVLAIAAAHRFAPDEIREIRVTIGPTAAAMLRSHAPATALEAKFSLEFAVACAAVLGNVGLRELDDARVADPPVRRLMAAVRVDIADTRCPIEPVFAYTDRVVLTLDDGRVLDSGEIRFARGNASSPLSDEELAAKFTDCTAGIDPGRAGRLLESLGRLRTLPDVRALRMPCPTRAGERPSPPATSDTGTDRAARSAVR